MGQDTLKVGIVGSRKYEHRQKIKDFIFKLKNEKCIDTVVVGNGGKIGAGKYVKKYTLEFGLQYQEFPPFHEFRELIFDSKGNYRTDRDYAANPGSACEFCEFYDTEHCKWGKIL